MASLAALCYGQGLEAFCTGYYHNSRSYLGYLLSDINWKLHIARLIQFPWLLVFIFYILLFNELLNLTKLMKILTLSYVNVVLGGMMNHVQ